MRSNGGPEGPVGEPAGRALFTHERILAVLLVGEVALFGAFGSHFLSAANGAEVARASVEVGLLALALTPVIITGGIDLSVGSLLGLAAVVMGAAFRNLGLPMGWAALLAVAVGATGGGLNAVLIGRLKIPPLIVTLGTFSLFRGLAEGLTGGVVSYSNFPGAFLFLGQGSFGPVPAQLLALIVAAGLVWLLVHRMAIGRSLRAIGYSPEGARYAGIPVQRRLVLVYVLSGLAAGLAAVIYVARLGQAKADAGTGFELVAITAVVLGGTSIFGGSGTVHGTLLGLVALALLQNGLRLSDQPTELAGILTGVLLLGAIGARSFFSERKRP
jgi:ribose/xylose/arabinose/galactoside ABC-type transport system permease subunit